MRTFNAFTLFSNFLDKEGPVKPYQPLKTQPEVQNCPYLYSQTIYDVKKHSLTSKS